MKINLGSNKKTLIKWNTTSSRYVCFLDIMGFKELISRNSHIKVFNLMSKLIGEKEFVQNYLNTNNSLDKDLLYITTFSDSIIIFTKDSSVDSQIGIILAVNHLVERALSMGIPLKGALSYGKVSIEKDKQIFFGQALIDAYLLQEEVFYYGVLVHNSAEKKLSRKLLDFFHKIQTPLKSGNIYHSNFNWFSFLVSKSNSEEEIKKSFLKIIKIQEQTSSGRPRKYLDNTIQVFNEIYPNQKINRK